MNEITPVLLAGGYGKRLWPFSRKSYPKQFLEFFGDKSLFQQSALRLISSEKINFNPHITITNSDFRFIIGQQLVEVGIDPGPIIIEPESKNTAPAILSSTLFAYNKNKDSILLIAPSDHVIPNINKFHDAVNLGLKEIQERKIVTFGIQPTHAETGYGYLELEEVIVNKVTNLISFVEKPDKETAKDMLTSGNYLWNSGIFLFRAKDMIEAFEKYAPDILFSTQEALTKTKIDLDFLRLDPKAWSKCRNVSIDFAIMEKAENLSVVPFYEGWSDLGNWEAVWQEMKPDNNGVSLSSNAHALQCSNTLLRSESNQQEIIGLGLNDIIAIAMPDSVLVAHKDKVQDIKGLVTYLKSKNISQAENSTKDHRPWGWFENIAVSDHFKVKKIYINPEAAISLQSHNHRSEHWIIVEGVAKVTIQEEVTFLKENQSIFVPKLSIHRVQNTGELPLIMIEVQMGKYLGEDDIVRYEDMYSRI